MILEGAMIVLATTTMTVFHPGRAFGAKWKDAGWNWKRERMIDIETAEYSNSDPSSRLKVSRICGCVRELMIGT